MNSVGVSYLLTGSVQARVTLFFYHLDDPVLQIVV